jgi:hypothetical protein
MFKIILDIRKFNFIINSKLDEIEISNFLLINK